MATLGDPTGPQLARPVQAPPEIGPLIHVPNKGARDTIPKPPGWLDA